MNFIENEKGPKKRFLEPTTYSFRTFAIIEKRCSHIFSTKVFTYTFNHIYTTYLVEGNIGLLFSIPLWFIMVCSSFSIFHILFINS